MSIRFGEWWRRHRRRWLAPLKPVEAKIRGYCQHFILKTIHKHGVVPSAGVSSPEADPNSLIIPLLHAKRRAERYRQVAPVAATIGEYLLTTHPRADFFYHLPTDLAKTAWVLRGDFQPEVTAWICDQVGRDDRVLILGGEQGYHALSIAAQLGEHGRALVLNLRASERDLLELNVRTNRFEDKVGVQTIRPRELEAPSRSVRRLVAEFAPTLTFLELPTQVPVHNFDHARWHVVNSHSVLNGEVVAVSGATVAADSVSPERKAA